MAYQPGKHIIASLHTEYSETLSTHHQFRDQVDQLISKHSLEKLGEIYHDFSPGGFTAVICLSESHISIHTWPEHQLVNLDIYLSNFMRKNDGSVEDIYNTLKEFFKGKTVLEQTIIR